MQTFLPYTSFRQSAQALDPRRLGTQRLEGFQILRCNLGLTQGGWSNHPATLMWRGYEVALMDYTVCICQEWISRGYEDNLLPRLRTLQDEHSLGTEHILTPWLSVPGEPLQQSHQAALMAKMPQWYSRFNWPVEPQVAYWWPTQHKDLWQ